MSTNQEAVATSSDLLDIMNESLNKPVGETNEERTERLIKEEQAGEDYLKSLQDTYNEAVPPKDESIMEEIPVEETKAENDDDFLRQISDEHDKTIKAERDSYIAALVHSSVDAFLPPVSFGVYAIEQIFGMDITKGIMGQGKVEKERDKIFTKDADNNMILNGLPKLLTTIAFFTNNNKFKIAASSLHLIMPIVQNVLAKRSPLAYKDTTPGSHDILQTIINALPLIVSCVTPLINMDKIKEESSRVFNEAKDPRYALNNGGYNSGVNQARGVANLLMPKSF